MLPAMKIVNHVYPDSATIAAATALTISNYIDTKGWGHLRVLFTFGGAAIAMTAAPKLQACDTTAGTFADITDAVLAAAPTATADGYLYAIDVDLSGGDIPRFVQVLGTKGTDATTGTGIGVIGILTRPCAGSKTNSAADMGLNALVTA